MSSSDDGVEAPSDTQTVDRAPLREVLDVSDVGVFVLGPDFTVEWVNATVEKYFGVDSEAVVGADKRRLVEETIADRFERPQRFADIVLGAYDDETHAEAFTCHVRSGEDRAERWLLYRSHPIESGEFAGGRIEQYTDITDGVGELERTKALLEQAQSVATVGGWELDVRTDPPELVWTDEVYRIHGLETGAGVDLERAIDCYHPDDREQVREAVERAIEESEPYDHEVRLVTADGDERWVRSIGVPVTEDGDVVAVRGSIQDVTDRKERERQLARQNDLFEKAQDIASVGAWEYDPQEGDTHFSQKVYEIYGVDSDYDPEPEKDIQRFYHPDDRETVREAVASALEDGEEYDIEVRITAADGTDKWVRTRGDPHVEDGEVVRVRGTIQDITDRKERERELERTNERLDEFASVVSHDLRNPLQVARVNLDLAREEYDDERLDAVARSHDRMEALVDDLLALARTGESTDEPRPVALASLARDCWQTVETEAATLEVETDRRVEADPSQLRRLFENLFRNSVEHGSTEPGSQTHGGADDTVTITVGDTENPAGFYVADDGSGIPEGERGDVFEPGYSTAEDGTGFGLSIVEEVAEMHDWTVGLTESDAGGARFEFTGVTAVE